jgi:hypothetical protein
VESLARFSAGKSPATRAAFQAAVVSTTRNKFWVGGSAVVWKITNGRGYLRPTGYGSISHADVPINCGFWKVFIAVQCDSPWRLKSD